MEDREAKEIISIMLTADGECPYCTRALLKLFVENFPEYKVMAKEEYKMMMKDELYNDEGIQL